jgi:hypothetical protein
MTKNVLSPVGIATVFLATAAALTLAGCSDATNGAPKVTPGSPSAQTELSGTTPAAPPPEILSLEQLHQKYIASGLSCDWVITASVMLGAIGSGSCTDSENGISTFTTQADVDSLLKLNKSSIEPGLFLVGEMWVVGSEHPEDLITAQKTMGGELWPADSAFFADK